MKSRITRAAAICLLAAVFSCMVSSSATAGVGIYGRSAEVASRPQASPSLEGVGIYGRSLLNLALRLILVG